MINERMPFVLVERTEIELFEMQKCLSKWNNWISKQLMDNRFVYLLADKKKECRTGYYIFC